MRLSVLPYIVWLMLLCTKSGIVAQNTNTSYLYQSIQKSKKETEKSNVLTLLELDKSLSLLYNFELIKALSKNSPPFIEVEINLSSDKSITVQLIKNDVLMQGATNLYHGVIADQPHSIVNLSLQSGTIYLNVHSEEHSFRIYPDHKQKERAILRYTKDEDTQGWDCDNTESTVTEQLDLTKITQKSIKSDVPDTLDIYIETDYAIYLNQGSALAAQEYVARVMNRVGSIYYNENILLRVSDLHVWTTDDPYDYTTSLSALNSFLSQIPCDFDGDIAHLISGRDLHLGGVAYVQGLLNRTYAGGFSNVHFDEQQEPFSWDVNVIAHEIGHNLGSRHTHDCVWGPYANQAIDGCYIEAPCNQKSVPEIGGTIMSYCHLLPVGINFSLGFGEEPGNVIRYILSEAQSYDGHSPHSAQVVSDNDSILTIPAIDRGYGAHQPDANHAYWQRLTPQHDALISIKTCDQGVDTRLFVYQGECESLELIANSDDDCHSANGLYYAAQIDSLYLSKGVSYYIEWDDRWSTSGFSALFSVAYFIDPCDNGVQDGNETGIDCGGTCIPCAENTNCTPDDVLPPVIVSELQCKSNDPIAYQGSVLDTANLMLTSPISVELSAGFEILTGGELTIKPEACIEPLEQP